MKQNKVFYGWIVLVSTWLIYFLACTPGAYGSSVVATEMVLQLGLPEAVIGWGTSAYYAASTVSSVPVSVLAQRKGTRFTLLLGCFLTAAAFLVNFAVRVPVLLYVLLFFVIGAGGCLAGTITAPGLVNAWFDRNKALPMSLLLTAGAFGGFMLPMISQRLVETIGWKSCWLFYGILAAIALVLVFLFTRNRPEELGEVRDGRNWCLAHPASAASQAGVEAGRELGIREALKERQFPTICLMLFGVRLLFTGSISYLVLYAVQNGVSPMYAAASLSCFHICGMAGRVFGGVKIPLPVHVKNGICYVGMAAGGAVLAAAGSTAGFFLAAGMIGFFYNLSYVLLTLMIPEYFGNKNYSLFFGTLSMIGNAGSAAAPIIVSVIAGISGSYRISYAAVTAVTLVCAFLAFMTPPSGKRETTNQSQM